MDFVPITKLKSKSVSIDDASNRAISDYANYIGERKGESFEPSDILTKVILDKKFDEQISSAKRVESRKVSFKLPESAWKKLSEAEMTSGLSTDELIRLAADLLLKDKKFLGWRKGATSK